MTYDPIGFRERDLTLFIIFLMGVCTTLGMEIYLELYLWVCQKPSNLIVVVGVLLLELGLRILGEILKFSSTMFEGKRIKLQEQGVTVGQTMMAPCLFCSSSSLIMATPHLTIPNLCLHGMLRVW